MPMIVIAGMALGAAIGAITAARRGGRKLDMLQYGAGFGIAFTIAGVFLSILIERMAS
jgi:hypothetical protein